MIRVRLPALVERRRVRGPGTIGIVSLAAIPPGGADPALCRWELSAPFAGAGLEGVSAIAWDDAGTRLAVSHSGGVSVYAYPSGVHIATSEAGRANSLAWVSDTRIVGIGGYGDGMSAYDLPDMARTSLEIYDNWFGDVLASEDGLYYAARAFGGSALSIYDAETLTPIDHGLSFEHVAGLAWSGPRLYVLGRGSSGDPLTIWSITPGDWDMEPVSGGPELGEDWWLAQMDFAPGGGLAAIGAADTADDDGVTIRVYSAPSWAGVATIRAGDKCLDLSWDSSGDFLSAITAAGDPLTYSVRIYSRAGEYSEEAIPSLASHDIVPMAAFSPTQTILAVGAYSGGPLILRRRCG